MKRLTHLSLFSGIGGIDLAAEAAGFETVCQCEKAGFPLSVLKKHWPYVPRFSDITEIEKEVFIEKTGIEKPTLISGGFPCQPFSQAGKRRGFADERYLWPEMFRVICELRPGWVVGENVAGFVRMGLDKTLSDLEDAGYCTRAFLIPACAVGAWHERERTFIIGTDVSDTACLRQRNGYGETGFLHNTRRSDTQENKERQGMDAETIGSSVLSCAAGKQSAGKICTQSILGGMADGLSAWMDGYRLWACEPGSVPRMSGEVKSREARLHALGNAVVPQQIYPILKYIYEIETGGDGL